MALTTADANTIDLREIAPASRHARIFSAFKSLGTNQALELINNQDPAPLNTQFHVQMPAQFRWETLEKGPEVWRVRVTKTGNPHAHGGCCGGCGGGA